jgi:hypothetical protein
VSHTKTVSVELSDVCSERRQGTYGQIYSLIKVGIADLSSGGYIAFFLISWRARNVTIYGCCNIGLNCCCVCSIHHVIMYHSGVEVNLQEFVTSELDDGELHLKLLGPIV